MDATLIKQLDALGLERPADVSEQTWHAARRRALAELRRARWKGRDITPANLRRMVLRISFSSMKEG